MRVKNFKGAPNSDFWNDNASELASAFALPNPKWNLRWEVLE